MNDDENPDGEDKSFFLELESALKALTVTEGQKRADELRRLFEELSAEAASNPSSISRTEKSINAGD